MEYPSLDKPKAGATRFNTDSSQLEIYDGNQWTGILSTSPEHQTGGTRGCFMTGYDSPADRDTIDYINISTTGNAIDFGNSTQARRQAGACSSRIRGLTAGGTPFYDVIDYITFSTTGDAVDFGNLVQQKVGGPAGFSNSTRGCFAGGAAPSAIDEIDYVTMASTGNAKDFGNLVAAAMHFGGSASSPTRGIVAGDGPAGSNVIQYVTTATTGNAADFGDLSVSKRGGCLGSSSNAVRGLFSGGYSPGTGSPAARTDVIDYITLAALGNAVDFGNLSAVRSLPGSTASSTRVVIGGGTQGSPLVEVNIIEYVQIASTGNSVDFGDLTLTREQPAGCSNGHGGLG